MASGESKKMQEFSTKAEMMKFSTDNPGKIIAVLFNVQYPDRGTLEPRLSWWRHTYEKDHPVIFCKRVSPRGDKRLSPDFGITITPAFLFFYNGADAGSLKDLNETKPDYYSKAKPDQDTDDEKMLKDTIDKLYKTHSTNKTEPAKE